MSIPLRVFAKDVPEARALKGTISTLAERLARSSDRIIVACDVSIEADRDSRDPEFRVSVEVRLADDEVLGRQDSSNRLDRALYDSFDAASVYLRRTENLQMSNVLTAAAVRRTASL